MRRSACGGGQFTVGLTVWLWLFSGFVSVVEAETEATFWMVELHATVVGTVKAMFTVSLCPLLSVILLQRTVFATSAQLLSLWAALNWRPLGTLSPMVTFCAVCGPLFVAVIV